jgi:hypothetical protein
MLNPGAERSSQEKPNPPNNKIVSPAAIEFTNSHRDIALRFSTLLLLTGLLQPKNKLIIP